jgi:hypothetical protein
LFCVSDFQNFNNIIIIIIIIIIMHLIGTRRQAVHSFSRIVSVFFNAEVLESDEGNGRSNLKWEIDRIEAVGASCVEVANEWAVGRKLEVRFHQVNGDSRSIDCYVNSEWYPRVFLICLARSISREDDVISCVTSGRGANKTVDINGIIAGYSTMDGEDLIDLALTSDYSDVVQGGDCQMKLD